MTCRDVGPGVGGTGWERRAQEPGPRGRSGPPAPGRVLRERPLTPGARQGADVLISAGHFGEGAGSACYGIDAVRICDALAPDAVASLTVVWVTTTRSIVWPRRRTSNCSGSTARAPPAVCV